MKEFISWDLVDECVLDIAEHLIRTEINFRGVYGIPRGGALLAVMLSHKLNIPFYPLYFSTAKLEGNDFIVIDDIADTGKTLQGYKIKDENEQGYYVTIHEHKDSIVKPDYSVIYKEDKLIVYPFETEDSNEIQDYLNEK